jgi:hypothetical protein
MVVNAHLIIEKSENFCRFLPTLAIAVLNHKAYEHALAFLKLSFLLLCALCVSVVNSIKPFFTNQIGLLYKLEILIPGGTKENL